MKKTIFLFACIIAFAASAKAQWQVGVNAGYALNTMSTDTRYAYDLNYGNRGGITFGVPVSYSFNDWFALRADVMYIQKNYEKNRSGFFKGLYDKTTNSFASLPLVAQFSFGGERLKGFVNGGGYIGYWLSSSIKGEFMTLDERVMITNGYLSQTNHIYCESDIDFNSLRDNRFDYGLTAGAGVEYRLNDLLGITAEVRHYYGLSNLYKNKTVGDPRYNSTWTFQIGCKAHLGDNSKK